MGSEMCIRDRYIPKINHDHEETCKHDEKHDHVLMQSTESVIVLSLFNRPFLSKPQPPFQSEAKCEVCYENQISFILKLQLIIIIKVSHLDSL